MILLMLACDPPPPPPPVEGPKVQTLLGEASGVDFSGDWTSPNCGGRAYARNIRFESDNTYAGLDLVSPCAPGTQCVWSGMVGYAGTWGISDPKVLQLMEMGAPAGPGSPHPSRFTADKDGNLIESTCVYTRGLTIPPGYTKEQVTPRVPTVPTISTEEAARTPEPPPSAPGTTAPGTPTPGTPTPEAPAPGTPTPPAPPSPAPSHP